MAASLNNEPAASLIGYGMKWADDQSMDKDSVIRTSELLKIKYSSSGVKEWYLDFEDYLKRIHEQKAGA